MGVICYHPPIFMTVKGRILLINEEKYSEKFYDLVSNETHFCNKKCSFETLTATGFDNIHTSNEQNLVGNES